MSNAPIVVHGCSLYGGRSVTMHRCGGDVVLGTAHSDHDLVVFLEAAGITDPDTVLDDPRWVEWRDGVAHDFGAACHSGQLMEVTGRDGSGGQRTRER